MYETQHELDHDIDMRIEELINSIEGDRATVIAAIRRQMNGRH